MQIEVFSLCDAATDTAGKLNILGAFDMMLVSKIPAVYPQCAVALRIRFERIERAEHKVQVHFVDKDGRNVIPPLESQMKVHFIDEQRSVSVNMILNIHGLRIDRAGEYSIDLAIDGQQKSSLPLFVKERPKVDMAGPKV